MNRVEKMREKKLNRAKNIKGFFVSIFSFVLLLLILYIGLEIVDETNRSMMSMKDPSFFSYNKLDERNAEIIFCGDRYLVNVEQINTFVSGTKEVTEYTLEYMKNFAQEKGEIVAKLVDDMF